MIKKLSVLALALVMMTSLAACGGSKEEPTTKTTEPTTKTEEPAAGALKDGTYVGDGPAGEWTDKVTVTVAGGAVTDIVWDAVNAAGDTKLTLGDAYGMPWYNHSKAMTDYVKAGNDPATLAFNAEGKTDAVSGCTVSANGFVAAYTAALAQAK